MSDHKARAREICSPEYFGGVRANDAQHVADVAEALRTVELEAYERAAKLCEQYRHDAHTFGAVPNDPMLAMSVAAREISSAIRALSTDSQDT